MLIVPANAINPVFQLSQWETQDSLPKHRGAITLFGDHDSLWEVGFDLRLSKGGALTVS